MRSYLVALVLILSTALPSHAWPGASACPPPSRPEPSAAERHVWEVLRGDGRTDAALEALGEAVAAARRDGNDGALADLLSARLYLGSLALDVDSNLREEEFAPLLSEILELRERSCDTWGVAEAKLLAAEFAMVPGSPRTSDSVYLRLDRLREAEDTLRAVGLGEDPDLAASAAWLRYRCMNFLEQPEQAREAIRSYGAIEGDRELERARVRVVLAGLGSEGDFPAAWVDLRELAFAGRGNDEYSGGQIFALRISHASTYPTSFRRIRRSLGDDLGAPYGGSSPAPSELTPEAVEQRMAEEEARRASWRRSLGEAEGPRP